MSTVSIPFTAKLTYSTDLESEISKLSAVIAQTPALVDVYPPRWLAIQLLEQDESLTAEVKATCGGARVLQTLQHSLAQLQTRYGEDVDIVLADQRYSHVNQIVNNVVTHTGIQTENLSDRVDRIVTHKWLGVPIFLALMWVVFKVTTDIAAPYVDWVDGIISGPITNWATGLLGISGLGESWLASLVIDGIIAGVGGVLVFVPVLMSLYLALAVLEDSGYMARAAFVMDRIMQKIGLHGKSFLPMVVGFGCSVPGLYATRTLDDQKDRILTGLLVPFMSCGARLPVYILFAAIFFPANTGLVIFGLYLTGIMVAILIGLLLRKTLFKTKEETPLLIELPPYRLPSPKSIWLYMWQRTSSFIRNAWTIILMTSIVIWFLMATPTSSSGQFANTAVDNSAFGLVSGALTPIFEPLGFGSWETTGALISGFVAKEVVVSTAAQVYNVTEAEEESEPTTFLQDIVSIFTGFISATVDAVATIPQIIGINLLETEDDTPASDLTVAIRSGFENSSGGHGTLAALAFMVFVLLYTPCMVAVAAMRQELGAGWTWLSVIGQFVIAWIGAFLVFQGGILLGLG